ncbi:hypothetical protein Gbro_3332 [Gordonia bronchialis DSM 43247]|jgi:hypothetical protein|uniref:Uncharacterized protein n=1 Tax=Gordonia bronchialis (strain ATCC 25592 / DSM 43247 / BCRC 13721 / JCM 3198 / KCTC 3076 / NBRC 16047 / NCTC 10667) TaxID=526226 RepID=D0LD43_GORB4|nr:hypothetical protein [Gordonia bronchialis]ACY22536.1 hypothetical protein Gbro_3332 [Gordonia bronchialis DSM 43247]MCC3325321.1 hypothetical protein [Gordonia bronchialis]UAK39858.1 hypothetical protein K8O93_09570 [Gordonia bronchialis]STQ65465.1 Uncharacterised protein [Gordonia bronchialis]
MGKVNPAKVGSMTPKKKCCRSSKRCVRCPVVVNRMRKLDTSDMSRKQLGKALKKARAS